jgi:hypothetical protein
MNLLRAIRGRTGVDLPLDVVFREPLTANALARALNAALAKAEPVA